MCQFNTVVQNNLPVLFQAYLANTHNLSGQAKTGENLLRVVLEDIKDFERKFGVNLISWVTDDGPDGKKMRRLLLKHFPHLTVLLCWAHQIQLILGDALKASAELRGALSAAATIVKWFNSHDRALFLLCEEQRHVFGKARALILPVITRWTSHYLSTNRLLQIKDAVTGVVERYGPELITSVGREDAAIEAARNIVSLIKKDGLWETLQRCVPITFYLLLLTYLGSARFIFEPLAVASVVLQASSTRMDHVLLTLGNLYHIYSITLCDKIDNSVRAALLKSLEKRWKAADQPIFILAVIFNPFIRADAFTPTKLTVMQLWKLVQAAVDRFWKIEADSDTFMALKDYLGRVGDFSDMAMELARFYELAKRDVRSACFLSTLITYFFPRVATSIQCQSGAC
jgi:hypothetical protein